MDPTTATKATRTDKTNDDHVSHVHAQGMLPCAYPGARLRARPPRRRYNRPPDSRSEKTPQAAPSMAVAIACALFAPIAALIILGFVSHVLTGAVMVTVVAAISITVLGVLTRLAHMPWGYVCFVAAIHVLALIVSLMLSAADDATNACRYVMACLVAFQPTGFGIGILYGMTSSINGW